MNNVSQPIIASDSSNVESSPRTLETVQDYVNQYRISLTKTAHSIIELGLTVYTAKIKLGKDFKEFCNQIGSQPNSSTIKKWIKIGEKAELLRKHEEHIPSDWTTVYQLARLSQEQFDELVSKVEDGCVLTTAVIREHSGAGEKSSPSQFSRKPITLNIRELKVRFRLPFRSRSIRLFVKF